MKNKKKEKTVLNLVAKYAHEFNRASIYIDRTKFNRKEKHKNKSFNDVKYV
ncbi:hypothetical protein [Flavobacterium sp.]|uniref:DUF7230 family protein n=1 Tax=Flavobacterium sp. TaxID=239 RepID=UPI0026122288|nr:hypothetical protein [Flavobacterium sp.]